MNKIFDVKIFKEGVRTLRPIGIISTVIFSLFSLFSLISELDYQLSIEDSFFMSLSEYNILLVFMFCVVTPIMTLTAFNFTTKRASSDYYFSIPKTRTQLFFSLFLSVMFWSVFGILVSSLIPYLVSLCFPSTVIINYTSSIMYILGVLVSCFMVASAVMIAISTTGNFFANILVSLMIIFIPRIFYMATVSTAVESLPIFNIDATSILSSNLNIPFGLIFGMFTMGFTLAFPYVSSLYTFILGVIYLGIAYVLFKRRKSEIAGLFAANSKIRSIFRVVLASAVGLATVGFLFYTIYENDDDLLLASGFFLILSFVVYCIYELIATKSAKQMVKAMPKFYMVILVNLVCFGIMFGIRYYGVSFCPKAADITSVSFSTQSGNDYFDKKASEIEITDFTAVKVVADALEDNIDNCKTAEDNHYYYTKYSDRKYSQWFVTITKDGIKHNRRLQIKNTEAEKLINCMEETKEYKNIYTELPDAEKIDTNVIINSQFNLSKAQAKEIYKAYLEDIKDIPFETHYSILTGNDYNLLSDTAIIIDETEVVGDMDAFSINVRTIVGSEEYDIWLPVNKHYKKALQKYLELTENESVESRKAILEQMKNISEQEEYDDIYFGVYGAGEITDIYITKDNYPQLIEELKKAENNPLNKDAIMFYIYSDYYDGKESYINLVTRYYLTQEEFDNIYKYSE